MKKLFYYLFFILLILNMISCSNKNPDDTNLLKENIAPTIPPVKLGIDISDEIVPMSVEIEGMNETVQAKYYYSGIGYKMLFDTDYFEVNSDKGVDRLTPLKQNIAADVYLTITRLDNFNMDDYLSQLKETITNGSELLSQNQTTVAGEYAAKELITRKEKDQGAVFQRYYLIETSATIFLIEMQYTKETEEGYLPRLLMMLDTLSIDQ